MLVPGKPLGEILRVLWEVGSLHTPRVRTHLAWSRSRLQRSPVKRRSDGMCTVDQSGMCPFSVDWVRRRAQARCARVQTMQSNLLSQQPRERRITVRAFSAQLEHRRRVFVLLGFDAEIEGRTSPVVIESEDMVLSLPKTHTHTEQTYPMPTVSASAWLTFCQQGCLSTMKRMTHFNLVLL